MGIVKFFWKDRCPLCTAAKQLKDTLKKEGVEVKEFNLDTPEGLAEASYYGILTTPSFIIEDTKETPIAEFRGEIPSVDKIKEICLQKL